jgi:hypothetical protein
MVIELGHLLELELDRAALQAVCQRMCACAGDFNDIALLTELGSLQIGE